MKKIYIMVATALCFSSTLWAQTFSDNFDSYSAGSYLTQSSTTWKTWSGTSGGADDIRISNAKSHSGSNSLYFNAGAANGTTDIILPFGGEYNTGTLNMSLWMFVETGKKAYFNYQEQSTLGKGWSVDFNFDSIGKFNLVNTTSGTLLTGSYTQNKWVKVEMNVNLNTNTWNFLVDGILMGSFQNSYRKISAMDIYAIANSSVYIDDVSYTYTPLAPATVNGTVTFIGVSAKFAGQTTIPTVEIRNLGSQVITSAKVNLTYNTILQSKTLTGLNLAPLATITVSMNNGISLLPGSSIVTAEIETVNGAADNIPSDNIKTISLNAPVPAPGKMVIAEEATGTWCQWCPRGAVWLKNMDAMYDGLIIGIAVHNNDPMTFVPYDKGMGSKVTGYPSMLVDRGAAMDPSAMEADFLTRIMVAPKESIRAGAKYNAGTRTLDVSLTTKFNSSVSGNYKIAFVLVEDSVTGTTSKFAQSNAYSGGGNGVMGGFEALPNPVPANKMVYDHVGRVISPSFNGLSNAFKPSINAGDSFTHNFSILIDPSWSTSRMHLVGMVIDPSGMIDNGSTCTFAKAIQNGYITGTAVTGITSLAGKIEKLGVYPNPSNANFTVNIPESVNAGTMKIYNMQGQMVKAVDINGKHNVDIDGSIWPAGIYNGVIENDGIIFNMKMIKD
jgi:hypothetical protein